MFFLSLAPTDSQSVGVSVSSESVSSESCTERPAVCLPIIEYVIIAYLEVL